MHQILTNIFAEYQKRMDNADKEAEKEFAVWQREFLKNTFNSAITEFYSAYQPTDYKRRGDMSSETGGLYNLFELSGVSDGGAKLYFEDDYSDVYSEANMHAGRRGYNGLFELVFVEGYHGGSRSISANKESVWGAHPSPGTPYWRRRGFVRALGRMHPYGKWGRRAAKSTPPKDLVKSKMSSEFPEMMGKWKEMKKVYEDAEFQKIGAEFNKAMGEYVMGVINRYLEVIR